MELIDKGMIVEGKCRVNARNYSNNSASEDGLDSRESVRVGDHAADRD